MLVVDDDQVQRTIIGRIGAQAGFKVAVAAGFEEAAAMLKTQPFDCVTLDLGLGERSGALLLPVIANIGCKVPVVVISGAGEDLLEAMSVMSQSLSIDTEIFTKPLNLQRLRDTLTRYRENAALAKRMRRSA
ncbi:MAG: response regulator [Proteobacteria bacterium]|nr:response regulator [Pseudomonadota bacterium]